MVIPCLQRRFPLFVWDSNLSPPHVPRLTPKRLSWVDCLQGLREAVLVFGATAIIYNVLIGLFSKGCWACPGVGEKAPIRARYV
jgi:hypothetical protein